MYRHWPLGSLGSVAGTAADRHGDDGDSGREDMPRTPASGRDILLAVRGRVDKGGEATISWDHALQS